MGLNIIPTDGVSVFAVVQALQNTNPQAYIALVRPNNPPPGIAGFLFDVDGDDTVELVSEISQHYVEDNTTIQDQIALKPERITLDGFVAELVYTQPLAQQPQNSTGDALPPNPAMSPTFSPGTLQTQAQLQAATGLSVAAVSQAQTLYRFYQANSSLASPNNTYQSQVFGYFYQLWQGRQLVTVETPWGVMTNMAIESVRVMQPEETKSRSDFTVTFQKIRTAGESSMTVGQLAGRAANQQAPQANNGNLGQTPITDTIPTIGTFQPLT